MFFQQSGRIFTVAFGVLVGKAAMGGSQNEGGWHRESEPCHS